MSNLLLRGLSGKEHARLRHQAYSQNLSVNQYMLKLIRSTLNRPDKDQEKEARHAEAFRRLDEMRERLHRKYGLMDDSTKLIREDRDSR